MRQLHNPVAGLTALEQLDELDRVVKESREKRLKIMQKLSKKTLLVAAIALTGCASVPRGPSKDWQGDLQEAIDAQKQ